MFTPLSSLSLSLHIRIINVLNFYVCARAPGLTFDFLLILYAPTTRTDLHVPSFLRVSIFLPLLFFTSIYLFLSFFCLSYSYTFILPSPSYIHNIENVIRPHFVVLRYFLLLAFFFFFY